MITEHNASFLVSIGNGTETNEFKPKKMAETHTHLNLQENKRS